MKTDKLNVVMGYLGFAWLVVFFYLCLINYTGILSEAYGVYIFLIPFVIMFLINLIRGKQ